MLVKSHHQMILPRIKPSSSSEMIKSLSLTFWENFLQESRFHFVWLLLYHTNILWTTSRSICAVSEIHKYKYIQHHPYHGCGNDHLKQRYERQTEEKNLIPFHILILTRILGLHLRLNNDFMIKALSYRSLSSLKIC